MKVATRSTIGYTIRIKWIWNRKCNYIRFYIGTIRIIAGCTIGATKVGVIRLVHHVR